MHQSAVRCELIRGWCRLSAKGSERCDKDSSFIQLFDIDDIFELLVEAFAQMLFGVEDDEHSWQLDESSWQLDELLAF